MTPQQTFRTLMILAIAIAFVSSCNRQQHLADDSDALPKLNRADYSKLPNPEPPEDDAALVGVSDPGAPNERLLGWLGHLDPENTDREPVVIDEAAVESLRNGAKVFDCGPFIFDEALRDALGNAPKLKWLRTGRKTSSSDLQWICRLVGLRGLSLKNADLSDADLNQLEQLNELRWLDIGGAKLPADKSLPGLPKLEALHIPDCDVSDSYAPREGQFPKLRVISMDDTKVTDAGIKRLVAANPELRYLHLFGCSGVTGKSAIEIGKLKQLRYTHLGYTTLSDELYENWVGGSGLPRLQVLIPNCYIGVGS